MHFDFGDVLTHAWKITWKHKVLWIISVLPFLTMFLLLPFWLILLFQKNVDFNAMSSWMENPIYRMIAILVYLAIIASSAFLKILPRSSLTLGIYRAEAVLQPLRFANLLREGFLRYFWRILGICLLVAVGTVVVFLAFFMMHIMQAGPDFNTMIRIRAVFGVVILPLMALLQGFSLTYIKSAMMLTCLRLTRPAPSSPLLPGTVEAPA